METMHLWKKLTQIKLVSFIKQNLPNVDFMMNLKQLQVVDLSQCRKLLSITPLIGCKNLVYLNLGECWALDTIEPILHLFQKIGDENVHSLALQVC